MKLITFAVPCYNSAAYMRHCADTLLTGGDQVEIILVDDGSADETGAQMNMPSATPISSAPSISLTAATAKGSTRGCATPRGCTTR